MHNALIAFGWVQTADTGQINFATVTRATTTNVIQGVALYHMNDSLQGTTAVFLKLGFGTGGTGDTPRLDVQVGIGSTNGSGTLTGQVMTSQALCTGPNLNFPTTTLGACRSSGDAGSFRCNFWTNDFGNLGFTVVIERDKDSSGADTANGVNVVCLGVVQANQFVSIFSQHIPTSGSLGLADTTRLYAPISSASSQSGDGTNAAGVAPVHTSLGPMRNPMLGMLLYAVPDFVVGTTSPVPIYGASHTYLFCRANLSGTFTLNQWNPSTGMAILYE
jgi:hypothetical protein